MAPLDDAPGDAPDHGRPTRCDAVRFPPQARAPRGTHPAGHDAAIVWFLRWAAHAAPFTAADLGWNEDARFAMEGCVLNAYIAPRDGGPLPVGWKAECSFVISAAGRTVLAHAAAADPGATRIEPQADVVRADG